MPFGLSASAEIFQRKLLEALDGLKNVCCIADDVIIHGRDLAEHDKCLDEFLKRCDKIGIVLNDSKMELRKDEITFMGHLISKDGLQTDPEKVKAIAKMTSPQNIEGLRRFLGVVNFLSKFVPNMSDIAKPLHNLVKKDVPWNWSKSQQTAFEALKKAITDAPVLTYYDPKKELVLENDASQNGLGSAIFQDGKPIAYASRVLTDTEQRYAQIEKEMLAVTFGLEKFRHYTYGRDVTVITDHKPLTSIVKKPLSKAPKRLQYLLLRAQEYNYNLIYKAGSSIPVADALSRSPIDVAMVDENEYVSNLFYMPISDERLAEFKIATAKDPVLQKLKETIMQGWPSHRQLTSSTVLPYYNYRDELSVQDGLILRGDRIVIPTTLRQSLKKRLHVGHLGINSCLRRARDLVYWPGMSKDIRQYIEACSICASHSDKQPSEPLHMHETPTRPWERVGCDIFTIRSRNYLVTVDYCSNFFEVDFLPETDSSTVITKLKHHFARHGIPDVVKTDNGPQFISNAFKNFSTQWSFKHETSSPGNSKSNGAAESAVKIAKRIMIKCNAAHEDPYLGLLNYRNTPTEGMTTSPAQRLMGRRTKATLPMTTPKLVSKTFDQKERQALDLKRANAAAKQSHKPELKPLQIGQSVRMQPIQTGQKLWKEGEVTKTLPNRSYEVKTPDGKVFRRSRQHIRPTRKPQDDNLEGESVSNQDLSKQENEQNSDQAKSNTDESRSAIKTKNRR